MCPIFNLKICDVLYEKYLAVRKNLDNSIFCEEPEGVIRFRTTNPESVSAFWATLGYEEPLLCYVFSNTTEYRNMLTVMRDKLTADELESVNIYNAETGEHRSLASSDDSEPVLLAVHSKQSPSLERKLLSVFRSSGVEDVDDDDCRESRTLIRDDGNKDRLTSPSCNGESRSRTAAIPFDDFEQEFLRQVEKQETERKEKSRKKARVSRASQRDTGRGGH